MTRAKNTATELPLLRRGARTHLSAFARDVRRQFPGVVQDLILFGSQARGDARADSDYDVAVLVGEGTDLRALNHAVADAAYDHILAGYHIRPVVVPATLPVSSTGLAMTLAREGISIP